MYRFLRLCTTLLLVTTASYAACNVLTSGVRIAQAGGSKVVDAPECNTATETLSWLTVSITAGKVTITAQVNNAAGTRYGKVRVGGVKDIFVTQYGTSAPTAVASVPGVPRKVPDPGNPPVQFRVAHHLSNLLISIEPLTLPTNATADIIATSDGYFANDVAEIGDRYPALLTVDGSSQTFTSTLTERNELRWLNVPIGALQATAMGTLRLRISRLRATGTKIALDLETTAPFALSNADVLLTAAEVVPDGITFSVGSPFSGPISGHFSIPVTVAETVATAFAAAQGDTPGTRFLFFGNLTSLTTYSQAQSTPTPAIAQLVSGDNRGAGGAYITGTPLVLGGVNYQENGSPGPVYQIKTANDSTIEAFSFNVVVEGSQGDAQDIADDLEFFLAPYLLYGVDPCGTIPPNSSKPVTRRSACGSQPGELDVTIDEVAIVGSNRRITYTVTNTFGDDGPSTPVVVRGNAGLGYSFASCTRNGVACPFSGDTQQLNISDLLPGTAAIFVVELAPTQDVPDGTLIESVFTAVSGIDEEVDLTNNQVTDAFIKQSCSPLTPANPSYSAAGGTGSVNVPNCFVWTASSTASWITITSPTPGVENFEPGTVNYTVAPFTGPSQRTGTLTIAGTAYTITQRAACSFTVGPPASRNVTNAASATTFSLTTNGTNCAWTATNDAAWFNSVTPSTSTNSQTITINYQANDTLAQRTGKVTFRQTGVTGGPFGEATIIQAAGDPCTLSLATSSPNIAGGGGTGTLNVTATGAGCSWTLSETATWLSLSATSGTTSAAITYTAIANPGAARSIVVSLLQTGVTAPVGTVTVTQLAAPPCTLLLTSVTTAIPQPGGTGTLNVTASGTGCSWTLSENADWLTLSATTGTASAAITYTAAANTGAVRSVGVNLLQTGVIAPVASVTLNQAALGSCVTLSPITSAVSASGQTGTIALTAATPLCSWTSSSAAPWLQVSPVSGLGSGTLSYRAHPNFGTIARTSTIAAGGSVITVQQLGSTETVERRFIRLLYFSFLGRAATSAEVDAWLATGASRAVLARSFLRAPEFDLAGRFVAGLYVALLKRDPEYSGWLFQRDAIITGAGQQCAFATNFVNSTEFQLQNPVLSNEGFIQLLYRQVLGREAAPSEVAGQLPPLLAVGRGQLACNFLNAGEFRQRTDARLTAFLLYATLLLRDSSEEERRNLRDTLIANPAALDPLLDLFTKSPEINIVLQ